MVKENVKTTSFDEACQFIVKLGDRTHSYAPNVFAILGTNNTAILSPEGALVPIFMYSAMGSFLYSFTELLVTNLSVGWIGVDPSVYKGPNDYKSGATGHINLIYSPVKSVNVGIEYQIGQRININEFSGFANRIQLSRKYIF